MNIEHTLTTWLFRPDPATFPYDVVVEEFHRVGKHFVDERVLHLLDRARSTLAVGADDDVANFLDFALDKYDGRYDNPSYIALDVVELPTTQDERDRLIVALIADTVRFETTPSDRDLPPDGRLVAKRCRLAERAARPALARLGLHTLDDVPRDPVIERTALPVSRQHDEYLFLRMLQCYEATFALIAAELRRVIAGDGTALAGAERALLEARPLWSIVATMRPQAFLAFREYTDGASAIQSRNYKLVESLCRRPDPDRLDSPAYRSVPEVRAQVERGLRTVSECTHLDGEALRSFEDALTHWRRSHYKLAVRMLGERRGTGYTEGVPYLAHARTLPVFDPFSSAAA